MKISHTLNITKNLLSAKISGAVRPIKVTHYVTYRCNLQCAFCKRRETYQAEMKTGSILKLMDEFSDAGTCVWTFNGGEPLLRNDIKHLASYAKKLGFYTSMVTNGTLIDKNHEAIGFIDHFDVSLDGDEETHDSIRGKSAYERTLKGLEMLSRAKKAVTIMTVINKENAEDLSHVLDVAEKFGFSVKFQPIHYHADDIERNAADYFPEEFIFKNTIQWIIDQKKKNRPIITSFSYLNLLKNAWPSYRHRYNCYAGRLYCYITPEGNITPCCGKVSIIETHPDRSYDQPYIKAMRNLPNMSKCRDCLYNGPIEMNLACSLDRKMLLSQARDIFFSRHF